MTYGALWPAILDADVVQGILEKHGIDYECCFFKHDELDIDQESITTIINKFCYVRFVFDTWSCGEHWKYLKEFRDRDLIDKGLNPQWFKGIKPAISEICETIQKGSDQ